MPELVLDGCAPVPLGSYLKALGVFRLVAEQADPMARGAWRDERFVLTSALDRDGLRSFFLNAYEPSPIISPWNGRAGFLEGEAGEDGQGRESTRGGAVLVREYLSSAQRFWKLREAADIYRDTSVVRERDLVRSKVKAYEKRGKRGLSGEEQRHLKALKAREDQLKKATVQALRSSAPDWAIEWFDACQRIAPEDKADSKADRLAPLLGQGGVDGSRDFGMTYGFALKQLFNLSTGSPLASASTLLDAALFARAVPDLQRGSFSLYVPVGEGPNTTSGFSAEQPFDPWDAVLVLEGAMLFAGAATRRLKWRQRERASFPFTVSALTAGTGATAPTDDASMAEFWAPLWPRPMTLQELKVLLGEGRAIVRSSEGGAATAEDAVDFARAVRSLGSYRGVTEFQRFALLQREPQNPRKATPLARVRATGVSDLDALDSLRRWSASVRRAARGRGVPQSFAGMVRELDDAVFALIEEPSPQSYQSVLAHVGTIAVSLSRRPGLWKDVRPPVLGSDWAWRADDGSHEFALAASVAFLGRYEVGETRRVVIPFRRHLAPLSDDTDAAVWSDITQARALAMWTGRDLARDLAAILARRVLGHRSGLGSDDYCLRSLAGSRVAHMAAVSAFLDGATDDGRIAALTAGLAFVRAPSLDVGGREGRTAGGRAPLRASSKSPLPFAFAALKPLFDPRGVGPERRAVAPAPLVALLRAGDVGRAVRRAMNVARGAGLPTPFEDASAAVDVDPARLAAALLFPLSEADHEALTDRAYPSSDPETDNAA